jgi:hypothetical protein
MFVFEIIGYVIDCEVYCVDCTPIEEIQSEDNSPIFAGDENDYYCNECHEKLGE